MEIYILRHGIAEEAPAGMRDADRALTAEGRKKLEPVLRRARTVNVAPAVILSSPYRRARETAAIAAEILRGHASVIETKAFTPDSSPEAAWDEIRAHKAEPQVMIVGHEPLLSAVYAYLLGSPVEVDVKKGSLGRIDVERFSGPPRGVLRWLIYPKLVAE